jgi:hypothetical protein
MLDLLFLFDQKFHCPSGFFVGLGHALLQLDQKFFGALHFIFLSKLNEHFTKTFFASQKRSMRKKQLMPVCLHFDAT